MTKFSKLILRIATNSFVTSLIFLIGGFFSKEESTEQSILDGIGFYGIIITVFILLFHLLVTVIFSIIRFINKLDRENGD